MENKKFSDNTIMPFGKYAGLPLGEVPDVYLLWLYDSGRSKGLLLEYLEENIDAIKHNINESGWSGVSTQIR